MKNGLLAFDQIELQAAALATGQNRIQHAERVPFRRVALRRRPADAGLHQLDAPQRQLQLHGMGRPPGLRCDPGQVPVPRRGIRARLAPQRRDSHSRSDRTLQPLLQQLVDLLDSEQRGVVHPRGNSRQVGEHGLGDQRPRLSEDRRDRDARRNRALQPLRQRRVHLLDPRNRGVIHPRRHQGPLGRHGLGDQRPRIPGDRRDWDAGRHRALQPLRERRLHLLDPGHGGARGARIDPREMGEPGLGARLSGLSDQRHDEHCRR